jgi:ABC-type nitrate/sulfonate/bicarbonate transport system substrate-binding protein
MSKARDLASATPAPSTVSSAELGYLDGVTSAIQTQVDAKIAKTLTTTTGDIIYASGANTPARLAVGSTDDVLTVAGGVPTWAAPAGGGGMTLLSTTTLTGASTTVSSISGAYKDLLIIVSGMTVAATSYGVHFDPNGSTSITSGAKVKSLASTLRRCKVSVGLLYGSISQAIF